MSNISVQNDRGLRVGIQQSSVRQTPKTDFGSVMKKGAETAFNATMSAAGIAAPWVPGGQIVSAAVTGLQQVKASTTSQGPNANTLGGTGTIVGNTSGTSGSSGSGAFDSMEARAAAGDSQAQTFMATKELQEMNQSFNMQYLTLQENMQQENRKFTMLSNVMKTKHDTAKNAINNVR